jgi:hypothetical protein
MFVHAPEERRFLSFPDPGRVYVRIQIFLSMMVSGNFVLLAALFMEPIMQRSSTVHGLMPSINCWRMGSASPNGSGPFRS